jgi:hypothetical protein
MAMPAMPRVDPRSRNEQVYCVNCKTCRQLQLAIPHTARRTPRRGRRDARRWAVGCGLLSLQVEVGLTGWGKAQLRAGGPKLTGGPNGVLNGGRRRVIRGNIEQGGPQLQQLIPSRNLLTANGVPSWWRRLQTHHEIEIPPD